MYSEFETNDVIDVTDVTDEVECDVIEPTDTTDAVDDMLNGMSLDELYELRDSLLNSDVSDADDEIPDTSDITPIDEPKAPDYSYHWDGGPTHITEWDENTDPTVYTKKLTR